MVVESPRRVGSAGKKRARWALLGGVGTACVVGAGVRFALLGKYEFELDESLSWYCMSHLLDWPVDGPDFWREVTSIPYYFLLHFWSRVFGESEWALRSLPATFSALTIPVLAWTAFRAAGRAPACACAWIVAVNPIAVYYAHHNRVYAMWTFQLAVAGWLLFEASRRARYHWWIAYGTVILLTMANHFFTLFWLPATILCTRVSPRPRKVLRQWMITHALVGLIFLPYFWTSVLPVASRGSGSWIAESSEARAGIPAPIRTIGAFVPAGHPPDYVIMFTASLDGLRLTPLRSLVPVAKRAGAGVLIAVAAGVILARRRSDRGPQTNGAALFWMALALGPLLLAWIYSWIVRPNYVVGRYDMVSWSAWMVGMALLLCQGATGISRSSPRVVLGALVSVLFIVGSLHLVGMTRFDDSPSIRRYVRRILNHTGKDAVIIVTEDPWRMAYELDRQHFAGRAIPFPTFRARQIGWRDIDAELRDPDGVTEDAERLADRVMKRLEQGRQVWLAIPGYEEQGDRRLDVDRYLYAALGRAGLELLVVDSDAGLARIERAP